MKKIKLFLAAFAVMTGMGAYAQDWTSSSLESGLYVLYNVGSSQYFTKGNSWGTQASITSDASENSAMKVEIVLVGEKAQIRTSGNNDLYGLEYLSGGTMYTDQSRNKVSTWTFTQVDTDNGPVYNIISADNHGGGAGAYLTAEGGSSTIVGPGEDGTSALAKWKLKAVSDLQATKAAIIETMDAASLENPVDVTGLIGNANFESSSLPIFWAMSSSNKNLCGGASSNYCAESWHATFTLTQTIKNIPNGKYELTAQAGVNGTQEPVVYANDKTSAFVSISGEGSMSAMSASFTDGKYAIEPITVIVTDGTLTIGAKSARTDCWCIWDNFKLKYYGVDLTALQESLAEKVSAAAALENTVPAAVYNTLSGVVTEYNKNYATAEGYETAIDMIGNAITNAQTLVAPYAAYKVAADGAAIAGVATETINAQNTAVEEATTAEAIEACTAALQSAANDVPAFDITTFTITNPTAQKKSGWEGTDFGSQSNDVCEYWNTTPAGFHQTISLPAGTYRLTVVALQRTGMTGTVYVGDKNTVIAQVPSSTANSRAEAANWFNAGNGRNYVYFTATEAADFVIGLKVDETTGDHWTVWQSFKLETFQESIAADYLAPGYATLVESAQATLADATYVNVTGNEKTALEEAIAATPSTVAEYEAAVEALNNAMAAFTAAKTNYDIFTTEKALADAISTDITVDAPTTAENALTQFRALKVAEYNYVATAYPYSATSKIGDFNTWDRTGTVNGAEKNEFEALTSQHWSGTEMTYYEQPAGGWGSNAWTANYTKTTTLPAGNYVIKVAARAASGTNTTAKITCSAATLDGPIFNFGDTGRGITTEGVACFDEGTFAVNPNNGGEGCGWVWNYLPFTLDAETEVTMTIVAEANSSHQWFSVCEGELLSKTNIATAVAYNDASANNIEDIEVANVTISRNIKADFNTVVLPFDLTAGQVAATFGTGSEVYTFSENSLDPNDVTIYFDKVVAGTISANVPVLVKATQESTEQVFEGVQIVATTEAKTEGANFDFVGLYAPMTIAEGDYFIGNGALYKSTGNTNINAFRAYIKAKVPASDVKLYIGGELITSINEINGIEAENDVIFNLAGQRISKMQKGINIVNGKKVAVK